MVPRQNALSSFSSCESANWSLRVSTPVKASWHGGQQPSSAVGMPWPNRSTRQGRCLVSKTDSTPSSYLTPEEEAIYLEARQKRQARKQQERVDAMRRMQNGPIARSMQPPPQERAASSRNGSRAAPGAVEDASTTDVLIEQLSRPPLRPQDTTSDDPSSTSTATPSSTSAGPLNAAPAGHVNTSPQRIARPAATAGTTKRSVAQQVAADDGDDDDDPEDMLELEAYAQQLLREQDVPTVVPTKDGRQRPTAAATPSTAAFKGQRGLLARRATQPASAASSRPTGAVPPASRARSGKGGASASRQQMELAMAQVMREAQDEEGEEEEDDEHGLDWDKLVEFEKYQQYVNEVVEENDKNDASATAQSRRSSVAPPRPSASSPTMAGNAAAEPAATATPEPSPSAARISSATFPPLPSTRPAASSVISKATAAARPSSSPQATATPAPATAATAAPAARQSTKALPSKMAAADAAVLSALPSRSRRAGAVAASPTFVAKVNEAARVPRPRVPPAATAVPPKAPNARKAAPKLVDPEDDLVANDDPDDDDDLNMDEFSKLLNFFEKLDHLEKRAERAGKGDGGATTNSTVGATAQLDGASAGGMDAQEWREFEALMLGKEWDKELLDDQDLLAGAAEEGEEEEEAPWLDAVTTLLLGLVDMSHRRYLGRHLLQLPAAAAESSLDATAVAALSNSAELSAVQGAAAGVSGSGDAAQTLGAAEASLGVAFDGAIKEEDRAAAYWDAPFALIVQDDSKEACLEYANAAALRLLGCEYLDLFEMTSFQVVDPSPAQQQEWLWACNDAEGSDAKFTTIPELRLVRAGGTTASSSSPQGSEARGTVLARNVLVFRIDSLEGGFVGQAIVIRDWQELA